jgi:hypothetical protein
MQTQMTDRIMAGQNHAAPPFVLLQAKISSLLCMILSSSIRLRLCRAASLAPFRGWFHANSSKSRNQKVESRNRAQATQSHLKVAT